MKRGFIIGDEWIYYKIYCGPKTADMILVNTIKPLVYKLIEEGLIDNWFFIRFNDPDYHLRLRFHLHNITKIGEINTLFYNAINVYYNESIVWKIQMDTYEREIERYGSSSIETMESFFKFDSELVINIISLLPMMDGEHSRWLIGMKDIDYILKVFKFSLEEKLSLLHVMKDLFEKEFNMDQRFKVQLDKKYREERKKIELVLRSNSLMSESRYLDEIFVRSNEVVIKLVERIINLLKNEQREINEILPSIIHMHCNRLFNSKQRLNEFVLYHFTYQYYRSELAKLQKNNILKSNN